MAGYIGSKASVVSSGAERKKVFDITTTTTSLTGLSYTPNQVHVFHNGVRLVDGTDYTATNGTSITLTTAAENGDQVVVISYATFQTSDTVSASAGGTFNNDVAINGDLTVDTNTLFVDAASNNVGIGTSSPATKFSVTGGYISQVNAGVSTFLGEDGGGGSLVGTTSNHYFRFITNDTERMRIDSAGRVTMPFQPHIFGSLTNTGGSGIANSFATSFSQGGLAFVTDRITVPVAGLYSISFNSICDSTTGRIDSGILINGTIIMQQLNEDNGTGFHYRSASAVLKLQANDYIQFSNGDWYNHTVTTFDTWRTASVTLIG